MGEVEAVAERGRLFVTMGTSVLAQLAKRMPPVVDESDKASAKLADGRARFLRSVSSEPAAEVDDKRIEPIFPGFPLDGSPGVSAEFEEIIEFFASDELNVMTVPELRALRALADAGQTPGPVVLLTAALPANRFAARAVTVLAQKEGWTPIVEPIPELDRAMTDDSKSVVIDQLVSTLRFDPGAGRPPHIVVAGGMKVLGSLVAILADRTGAEVSLLMGEGEETWLLPANRTPQREQDAADNAIVPSVLAAVEDWDALPAEVQFERVGRGSKVSDNARTRMAKRTQVWVVQDVWQADRLPQMVHHGVRHGRRVDRLATTMLRAAPMLGRLGSEEIDASFEALSAAAWLHDIGQRGGMVLQPGGTKRYVQDYDHVRLFHGLLSRGIVDEHFEELDLREGPVRFVAGALMQRHQRLATLLASDEPLPKMCKPEAAARDQEAVAKESDEWSHLHIKHCGICPGALQAIQGVSLYEELELEREREGGLGAPVAPMTGVRLAAILRLADAIDIGTHRVDGRWSTRRGTRSVEHVWRRDQVAMLTRDAEVRGDDDMVKAMQPLLDSTQWTAQLLASTTQDLSDHFGAVGKRVAAEITAYDKYVRDQAIHVHKHRCFAGAELIVEPGKGQGHLIARMIPSSAWQELTPAEQSQQFDFAGDYIWGEYFDSAAFLENDDVLPLRTVTSPGGQEMDITQARPRYDKAKAEKQAEEKAKLPARLDTARALLAEMAADQEDAHAPTKKRKKKSKN